tara:strand:+ start:262 stop:711 length:450 start_codon:yes stop_codon:yes gene_type:complete
MMVVGLDPDSKKHGVAVFIDGQLTELANLDLPALRRWIDGYTHLDRKMIFSIEDVQGQSFIYGRNVQQSKAAQSKVAMGVGRCQQAQIEVMRELDFRCIEYRLHKPMAGNWADKTKLFEMSTGWKGRSNPETRSAAFFGMLEARKVKSQ